ncbi:amine oxidase [Anaerocolumna cellulosilytica]|uniref:Amine oxidase n=1 Tax=Anaerocolumna cellulosilytica TaxID=433286 RepID=A0A6S6QTK2_9FIRM|nr:NAD(P)/FAD-dependent oxidoreductase [Anaerocolumna cellulosilytica]MBB5194155.1 monoamine oxidase [Anaerocolumna cellulosilytica]BCJ94633.1 amine oxidase [Anaerocolumna cellulosilytica]
MVLQLNPSNPMNPTDTERYQMLQNALARTGRSEDFQNIIQLLNPPEDITNYASYGDFKDLKIAIIGGGLAGMSAAFELRKLGADITIYEASEERIGGRVYTYYFDKDKKYYGEFGPMRIPVSHGTTWHYINLFHLITVPLTSPFSNNFLYVHNTRIRREPTGEITKYIYPLYNMTADERNLPWTELNEYAFSAALNGLSPDVRRELLQILPAYSPEYAGYINLSNRQMLEMLGLSQDTITLLASVDPLTGGLLNTSYSETLQEEYSLDYINTYRISGGMIHLPLAFYESLTNKSPKEYNQPTDTIGTIDFKLGTVINGIYQPENGKSVLLKAEGKNNKEELQEYDYVICSIPFSTLRLVDIKPFFTNQKMQAIRELNYVDSLKAAFLCKKRFWEENAEYGNMNGGISFTDLPIQSIIYPADHFYCSELNPCQPSEPGVLMAAYNLHLDSIRVGNQDEKRRFRSIKREVEEVHGLPEGYLNSIVAEHKILEWNHEYWARGAFVAELPGQKINFAYTVQEPEYNNRLFFAGEHTSTKHGWMQGSLYSGMQAANMLAYYRTRST